MPTRRERTRTPWDRLVTAARKGTGLRLTAEEVRWLAGDSAIDARGTMDRACFDKGHDPYRCRDKECEW